MSHLQILFNSYFFGLILFGEEFLTDRGTQKYKIFFCRRKPRLRLGRQLHRMLYFRPRQVKKSYTHHTGANKKNASDSMFVTFAFGPGDHLHEICDILYFYSLGV